MKHLYVVTHPQSQHHTEGLVGGWYDRELTELGLRQAACIGHRLRELIPVDASIELYSSDLKRTYQTAEAIAQRFGVPIQCTAGLREKSYGEAEGQPQAWLDERFLFPPQSGDRMDHHEGLASAESRRTFATRVYRAMERILASPSPYQIVVTHGFALTFVVAAWIKMPLDAAGYIGVQSTSGGITHLFEDDLFHNRGIIRINDTSHLARAGAAMATSTQLPASSTCADCGLSLTDPYGWCSNCRAAYCLPCGRKHFCTPSCPANGCLAGLCVRLVEGGVLSESWGLPE